MVRHVTVAAILLFLSSTAVADDSAILWQVGIPDKAFADLTFKGAIGDFAQEFPGGINYVVGKSDPKKDFSAIHPGPGDVWAGRKVHPFSIEFTMADEPVGLYELRIDLVDSHHLGPPQLVVDLNGARARQQLPKGSGDVVLLHPEKGNNQSHKYFVTGRELMKGVNRLELRGELGSWFLYDAISLRKLSGDTEVPMKLEVASSIFFIEDQGQLKQEFTVAAEGLVGLEQPVIEVRSGDDLLTRQELDDVVFG